MPLDNVSPFTGPCQSDSRLSVSREGGAMHSADGRKHQSDAVQRAASGQYSIKNTQVLFDFYPLSHIFDHLYANSL